MKDHVSFWDIWLSLGGLKIKCIKSLDLVLGTVLAFCLPEKLERSPSASDVKRLLIIRPGGIGDAVFLLPLLKALKAKNITVDVLCEKRNAQLFWSQHNLTHKIYLYDQWPDLWHVLNSSYDMAVDTEQWHFLSGIVSYFIKTKYNAGFATRPLRAKLFNKKTAYAIDGFELDNFQNLFDDLLTVPSQMNGCFEVPLSTGTWAASQIPAQSVTVFLGASIALRRFSKEQLLSIIHQLLSLDLHPVLLGGYDVSGMAKEVLKEIDDERVNDFVGKTSLLESAALIQRSVKFIGPDSGLMHLACAVGTPVIAIFGPGHLKKWQPQGSQDTVITENVSCSPCTKYGYTLPTCSGTYHCMKNIKIDLNNPSK